VPDHGVLQVTVEARQRLALGTGAEVSFFTDSHAFVPGSVLRGALAAAWIAEHGPPGRANSRTTSFRELFDGQIRYGPLYADGSQVVPVSVWTCKYPAGAACSQEAVDAAFEHGTLCRACDGPLEQGKGQILLPPDISMERTTRTSIDHRTARAKEHELYAHAAMPAGTTFRGLIHGRAAWLEHARPLRLGGRRTVGGSADYRAEPAGQPSGGQPLTDAGTLVIRLASPAIFVDEAGRPVTAPGPLDLDGATPDRSWARPVTWAGWHAASRLPKPEETCAVAGSTYQLSGPADQLRRLAARLQRDGIGLRRTEGFGDIEIVTRPWRPRAAADGAQEPGSETAALDWHRKILDLGLGDGMRRWVISSLRELQLHRARHAAGSAEAGKLAVELLERAASARFSGRQRNVLGELFGEPDLAVLSDVTILLAAGLPAAGPAADGAE
jgi:CRISPR-associated protein Csx10